MIVVSGSRPAQMSAIATRVRGREDGGEVVEQRGGPVVGQRLVDGPDAASGRALADGGEGLADRRRVVAVVVEHDHAARLALPLQATTDTRERGQAARESVRRHAEAERGRRDARARWPRCDGRRAAARPRAARRDRRARRARQLEGRASGVVATIRPRRTAAGPAGPAYSSASPRAMRRGPSRLALDERRHRRRCRASRPGGGRRSAAPGSPTFAWSVGVRRSRRRASQPGLDGGDHGVAGRRRRPGGPTRGS